MQDRHSPQTRKSLLATHGRTIHWQSRPMDTPPPVSACPLPTEVRFVPQPDSCAAANDADGLLMDHFVCAGEQRQSPQYSSSEQVAGSLSRVAKWLLGLTDC